MYERIKEIADAAVKLQNKTYMDTALREISALAATGGVWVEQAAELASMKAQNAVGIPVVPLTATTKKAAKK